MAIPFFSIDIKNHEFLKLLKNIFIPINTKLLKEKFDIKIKNKFSNKKVILLPSARLGFYLTLKKYFKENDEIIFSAMVLSLCLSSFFG